jgi:amino acid transporter
MGQSIAQAAAPAPDLRRELQLRDVVLFNVSAVAGVRGLVLMARAGSGIVTLCALAALAFFLPSAFAVIRLSRRHPDEGGMYVWARETLGQWHGFLCAWFYFLSNLLFYPALLLVGVSIAAYVGGNGERFVHDTPRVLAITVAVLWIAALVNVRGLKIAKWVSNLGAISTIAVPAVVGALAIVIGARQGSATRFTVLPSLSLGTVKYWASIALAFTGLELAPIAAGEIVNPRVSLPRAAWISAAICTVFYVSGTVALLVPSPVSQLDLVTGIGHVAYTASLRLHMNWISPLMALLISMSVAGALASYLAGNSRLPVAIGLNRHLPAGPSRLHPRWHTPYVSILLQALVSTVFLLAAEAGEGIQTGFQVLVDLMTIATLVPFLYIFGAAFRSGGRWAGAVGGAITMLAIVVVTIPPLEAEPLRYMAKVIGGCVLLAVAGRWLFVASQER